MSGLVFAFNAHTLSRLPHLQAQHVEFLPVVIFALDEVISRATLRAALVLALSFVLQALASVYLLVFTLFASVAGVIARAPDLKTGPIKRVAGRLVLAGGLAAIALLPVLLPYGRANSQGLTRGLADATQFSATWEDYLDQARAAGLGFVALGVEPGDRVAIHSDNRPEWVYADLGAQAVGAVPVGV